MNDMWMNKDKIGIGLLGFGTVGQGVAEIFQLKKAELEKICGKQLAINGIVVQSLGKKRRIQMPQNLFTTNACELIVRDDIDVIFELAGGVEEAREFVLQALHAGKPVVTANKALLAEHAKEIFAAAREKNLPLGFEASVAAGLPIIKIIRDCLASTQITEMKGIINGTTNFILSQMQEFGQSYDEAFSHAGELGYLEADPALDIDCWDAAHKLVILASIAFKKYFHLADIERQGIGGVTLDEDRLAREKNQVIKLVASATSENGAVRLIVRPEFLPQQHRLAGVEGGMSAVWLRGDLIGESFFVGPGAGALPTASAVVSDMIAMLHDPGEAGYGF